MRTSRKAWTASVLLVAAAIAGASASGLIASDAWIADLIDSFRVHVLMAAVMALPLGFTVRRGWRAAVVTIFLGCCLANGVTLIHAAQAAAATPKAGGVVRLKIVTVNLLWSNRQHQKLRDWLSREAPDVVVTQETTARWAIALDALHEAFPFRRMPGPNDDLAILSRHKLRMIEVAGIRRSGTLAIAALSIGERRIDVMALHASVPLSPALRAARDVMLDDIAAYARRSGQKLIVAGDFNATPWNHAMRRLVRDSPLRHAIGFWQPSWADHMPLWMGIPIDHVLAGGGCIVVGRRIGPDIGSDHRPVVAIIDCM